MKKSNWKLPFDERLIPDIFSFKYPKSPWVRLFLLVEMIFATTVVIGTLILVLLPVRSASPSDNFSQSISTESAEPIYSK